MERRIAAKTVVVGTGPGGATIARELVKQGESVLILEKGRDIDWPVGTPLAYATLYDIRKSKEGILVRRGITTGGSTMLYSGNAYDPPPFIRDELGIDLTDDVRAIKKELTIRPVPEFFFRNYIGTKRIVDAAGEMGFPMTAQERFIDYSTCDPSCDSCLFGCKKGAKWTAREYLSDAVSGGAGLITRCDVRSILSSSGKVTGVRAKTPEGNLLIDTDRVILAAGGLGTPQILLRSGIEDAGKQFFTDPMSIVAGVMKEGRGTFHEMTFTFANDSHPGEFVFGNTGAVNSFVAQLAALNIGFLPKGIHMKRIAGMFVKLCDDPVGSIDAENNFHKALTDRDERVMAKGVGIAKEVMVRAGVIPESISVAKGIGGHPGGTCAIGTVVDRSLMTEIENLYVCDNSIMPKSGGIPPVLTLIALGRRFARTML